MIPFLDLKKLNRPYEAAFKKRFDDFLTCGFYILGDHVREFEKRFAHYCHTNFCVGTGNGLDALTLIFRGYIEKGRLHEGDKIIVAANTYIATILAVKRAGLQPVLVEPDEHSFNIDPETVRKNTTIKTKAVLATHLYGQLADMEPLSAICTKSNMLLLADAAQSHGAELDLPDDEHLNFADATAYSFYPTKNLGALGDGGAITTDDKALAEIVGQLRNYGFVKKYVSERLGDNSRLDEIQAAFLLEKLKTLDADNDRRRAMARRYLAEIDNAKIRLPRWNGTKNHVFHLFVVRVADRPGFCQFLEEHEIGYNIHYPVPPHRQPALKEFAELQLPITEEIHKTVVSIPLNPTLTASEIDRIIAVLNSY